MNLYEKMALETMAHKIKIEEAPDYESSLAVLNSLGSLKTVDNLNSMDNLSSKEIVSSKKVGSELSVPGVLYRIEKGVSTFVLKMFASLNLKIDLRRLERGDRKIQSFLKMNEGQETSLIHLFPSSSFETANYLVQRLSDQRFPRYEDKLFNLSDPGFSWWGKIEEDSVKIFFSSRGHSQDEGLMKLGPIGDKRLFFQFFTLFRPEISKLFEDSEFELTEKKFTLKVKNPSISIFKDLIQFIKEGDFSLAERFKSHPSFYFFLIELSSARHFWREMEEILEGENSSDPIPQINSASKTTYFH